MTNTLTRSPAALKDPLKSQGKAPVRIRRIPSNSLANGDLALGLPAKPHTPPAAQKKLAMASRDSAIRNEKASGVDVAVRAQRVESSAPQLDDEPAIEPIGSMKHDSNDSSGEPEDARSFRMSGPIDHALEVGDFVSGEKSDTVAQKYVDGLDAIGAFEWPYSAIPDRSRARERSSTKQSEKLARFIEETPGETLVIHFAIIQPRSLIGLLFCGHRE